MDPGSGRARSSLTSAPRTVLHPSAPQSIAVEATGQLVVIDSVQSMEGFLLKAQWYAWIPAAGHVPSSPIPLPAMGLPLVPWPALRSRPRASSLWWMRGGAVGSGGCYVWIPAEVRTIVSDATIGSGPSFDAP